MPLLSNPLIERIGWTLLHSLWQGAAIALVYALVSWWARARNPELRYALSLGALALLALAPVVTFIWLGDEFVAVASTTLGNSGITTTALLLDPDNEFDFVALLQPWLPWVVVLWCSGVLLSAIRVWDSWRHLVALRRSAVPLGGPELSELVSRIATELGLTRTVHIARSALVESPTVIGWLEPMVLVPTAALAGLSPHQLAMILAHELAHIRRHDYFVNALQTVLETLMFFHPAVHWISSRARNEREECCDAVAVRFGGDALAYARALTELEELRGMRASLALAATGGVLLDRIERLLGQRQSKQRGAALASACALATLTALTASVGTPLLAPEPTAAETTVEVVAVATTAVPTAELTVAPVANAIAQPAPPIAPQARDERAGTLVAIDAGSASRDDTAPAAPATLVADAPTPAAAEPEGALAATTTSAEHSAADAPAAAGQGPLVSGGELIVGAAPTYPYGAERRRIGGAVTALMTVDASGRTRSVRIIAADPPEVFERAVVRALSNWRYTPKLEDGVPVAREIVQQLLFAPDNSECSSVTGTRLCRKIQDGDRRAEGVSVIRLN